jgi:hypothetical protein
MLWKLKAPGSYSFIYIWFGLAQARLNIQRPICNGTDEPEAALRETVS